MISRIQKIMVPDPKDLKQDVVHPNMLMAVTGLYAFYHVFSLMGLASACGC